MMLQILHCAMRIPDNDVNDENQQGGDGDGDDDDDDRGGDDHDDDDDQCGDVDDGDDAQRGDDDDDWRLAADQIPGRRQVATCVTPSLISCIH